MGVGRKRMLFFSLQLCRNRHGLAETGVGGVDVDLDGRLE